MKRIPIEKFGKDHWSLLAYVEVRCVEYKGILDRIHLRIKSPVLQAPSLLFGPSKWKPEYGTRLKGYWRPDGSKDPSLQLPDHDDLDCLDDLEEAGLIENFGTGLHPAKKMTKLGLNISAQLRAYKANGGQFAGFTPTLS